MPFFSRTLSVRGGKAMTTLAAIRIGASGIAAGAVAIAPLTARQDVALKDLMPKGMVIGVAINQRQSDGVDTAAVEHHHEAVQSDQPGEPAQVPAVHPAADRYAFDAQDRYVQFGARSQDAGRRPQPRVAQQTPAWVFQGADGKPADRATLLARMRDHIHTVVGRYKGKIHGWDVVNEAIDEDGVAAQGAVARRHRRRLRREGLRVRARGRSGRRALLQRLQPREAGQARRRDSTRQRPAGARAAHRRHRQPGPLAARDAGDRATSKTRWSNCTAPD